MIQRSPSPALPMRTSPVTIAEVARRAGVSKGTVSRILNGKNKENRPTIAERAKRVRAVAAELGYRPNAAARSIGAGRFNAVAFVTCSDVGDNYFPRQLIHGLHAGLQELGSRLVFSEVPAEALRDPAYVPQMLQESAVDGLIVYPNPALSEHIIPYFTQQRQPVVFANLSHEANALYPDERGGGTLAIDYFLERGRRRIGYLPRIVKEGWTHSSEEDRRQSFLHAMQGRDLAPERTRTFHARDGIDRPLAADLFLEAFKDVDAVLCYELEEALSLLLAALRRGLRVPEDLMILSYHEDEIRASTGVPIPTVIIPFFQLGEAAARMMAIMLDSGTLAAPRTAVPFTQILE